MMQWNSVQAGVSRTMFALIYNKSKEEDLIFSDGNMSEMASSP